MARLIAFGCSLTYGDALQDIWPNNKEPSKLAWPSVVSKMLNLECVNNGMSGYSNKEILNDLLTFEYQKGDTVICLWTFHNRHAILTDAISNNSVQVKMWVMNSDKAVKSYFKNLYTDYDSNWTTNLYMRVAKSYLDEKNIINYHANAKPWHFQLEKWNNVDFIPVEDIDTIRRRKDSDLAKDKRHPGYRVHKEFGINIANYIKGQTHETTLQ